MEQSPHREKAAPESRMAEKLAEFHLDHLHSLHETEGKVNHEPNRGCRVIWEVRGNMKVLPRRAQKSVEEGNSETQGSIEAHCELQIMIEKWNPEMGQEGSAPHIQPQECDS